MDLYCRLLFLLKHVYLVRRTPPIRNFKSSNDFQILSWVEYLLTETLLIHLTVKVRVPMSWYTFDLRFVAGMSLDFPIERSNFDLPRACFFLRLSLRLVAIERNCHTLTFMIKIFTPNFFSIWLYYRCYPVILIKWPHQSRV